MGFRNYVEFMSRLFRAGPEPGEEPVPSAFCTRADSLGQATIEWRLNHHKEAAIPP